MAKKRPEKKNEPQPQPVPWGWQSTGSDLPRATRRYDPAVYTSVSGNQVIVPPQEPPAQPQPVVPSGTGFGSSAGRATLSATGTTGHTTQRSSIETDYAYLRLLSISLEKMAREEIARLSSERPNDPYTIESNKKQSDLLHILADGFAKIAAALEEYSRAPQPLLEGKAKEIVDWVGAQLKEWWEANAAEARDWCIRLPILATSIGALGLAGADMTVATTAASALVGGPKVIAAIKSPNKPRKRP